MFGWSFAISRPSAIMPSASTVVALTSPLIGPSTIDAISFNTSSWLLPPSFAIKEGFVVTPQITPISFAFLMSSILAVSIKSFISFPPKYLLSKSPEPGYKDAGQLRLHYIKILYNLLKSRSTV